MKAGPRSRGGVPCAVGESDKFFLGVFSLPGLQTPKQKGFGLPDHGSVWVISPSETSQKLQAPQEV